MTETREIALSILMDMESNATFSNVALNKGLKKNQFIEKQDRAFITRLCEGVVEKKLTLDYIINQFSKTKVNKCKPLIRCLLRMGVYQIIYMDSVPDRAACNEMVGLAKKHGFGSLSGFVNGVLRNISRSKEDITYPDENSNPLEYMSVHYSMPMWLVQKIMTAYGEDKTKHILEALYLDRPTSIRVNTLKTDKATLKQMLEAENIEVTDGLYDKDTLLITGYDFIKKAPGFRKGYFTVQDESSVSAIRACNIKPGDTVLDVCSAPGGKSTAAIEMMKAQGKIVSMDIAEDKLELIEENIDRVLKDIEYDIDISIKQCDATEHINEYEQVADVLIADIPCSGLGIIGRKNDIKYRITEEGINELLELQKKILDNVKTYVKTGGTMLISTCTINPDENEGNVNWFIDKNPDFELVTSRLYLQGIDKCDGFYYAVLKKKN